MNVLETTHRASNTPESKWRTMIVRMGSRSVPYVAIALVTALLLSRMYGLRKASLSYPIQPLQTDGILAVYAAKALGANSFLHNDRVGAPFGLDMHDWYQPDVLHAVIEKALMAVTHNPVLTINFYYLFGYVLIAWSAFYVLRRFRLTTPPALVCSVLYAFIPTHLYRSFYHLILSEYYLCPLVVLLAVQIMSDSPLDEHRLPASSIAFESRDSAFRKRQAVRLLLFGAPLGLLVGVSGIYTAFYSCLLLATAAVYALWRPARRWHAGAAVICILCICGSLRTAMLPVRQYVRQHGRNPQSTIRTVAETEVLSLKLAELYLPSPEHPLRKLREVDEKYTSSLPSVNENESKFSTLGLLGAVGFSGLLLWPVVPRGRHPEGSLMDCLFALNLVALLYSITEGYGALFSFLVTPEIRGNNRIIFFLAFFSFAAFGFMIDAMRRRLPRRHSLQVFSAVGVLILFAVGLYDEGATQRRAFQPPIRAAYERDDRFIKRIETQVAPGSEILQLPFQSFPEIPGVNHMGDYEHLLAYIHSSNLRWSYPVMRGRPGDEWMHRLSSAPIPELVKQAARAGFAGIYIDRAGYADSGSAVEAQLRSVAQVDPIVSEDGRLSFFSLNRYTAEAKRRNAL